MKTKGQLDRNCLSGHAGDALLAGAGHNLRLILNALAVLLAWILCPARQSGEMAKPDTLTIPNRYQISIA